MGNDQGKEENNDNNKAVNKKLTEKDLGEPARTIANEGQDSTGGQDPKPPPAPKPKGSKISTPSKGSLKPPAKPPSPPAGPSRDPSSSGPVASSDSTSSTTKKKKPVPVAPDAPLVDPSARPTKEKVPIPGFEDSSSPEEDSSGTKKQEDTALDPLVPDGTPLGDIPSDIFMDLLGSDDQTINKEQQAPTDLSSTQSPSFDQVDFMTMEGTELERNTSGGSAEGNPFTAYLEGDKLGDFLDGGHNDDPTADDVKAK